VSETTTAHWLLSTPRRPAALVDAAVAVAVFAGSLLLLSRIGGAGDAHRGLDVPASRWPPRHRSRSSRGGDRLWACSR
jgi:hypothetical protein